MSYVLRYYSGCLILPSLISSVLPVDVSRYILYAWTVIGFSLQLLIAVRHNGARLWIFCIAFMAFNGLDLVGVWLEVPHAVTHSGFDWWSNGVGFRYLGTTNLSLWVPQHAIPAGYWLVPLVILLSVCSLSGIAELVHSTDIFRQVTAWENGFIRDALHIDVREYLLRNGHEKPQLFSREVPLGRRAASVA